MREDFHAVGPETRRLSRGRVFKRKNLQAGAHGTCRAVYGQVVNPGRELRLKIQAQIANGKSGRKTDTQFRDTFKAEYYPNIGIRVSIFVLNFVHFTYNLG